MRSSGTLRAELRSLARTWGTPALINEMTVLLRELATAGAAAELAKRTSAEAASCPRCRERDAVFEETKRILKRAQLMPPQGRLPDKPEPEISD